MICAIDPRVDYAFKLVFGKERNIPLLTSLIESVLPPGPGIDQLQIQNPFNDKERLDDKLSILDIKARDKRGWQFNIEMQMIATAFLFERFLYYWARFHQEQLHEDDPYSKLQPTILICFVNDVLFPEIADFLLPFELMNRRHGLILTDHLSLFIIQLPKFTKNLEELSAPVDFWLYFLLHAAELDPDHLPIPLAGHPLVPKAMEELKMMSQTEVERQRYESRRKAHLDELSQKDWIAKLKDREANLQVEAANLQVEAANLKVQDANLKVQDANLKDWAANLKVQAANLEDWAAKQGKEGYDKGFNQGVEKGVEKGREEGLEMGERESLIRFIHRFEARLGKPLSPQDQLESNSITRLQEIADLLEADMSS